MKKITLFLCLAYFQSLVGVRSLEDYFLYIQRIGQDNGDYRLGEIEVVLDVEEIARIQGVQEARFLRKGCSPAEAREFTRIGIICEDPYFIWIRDAVYFPNRIPGTYDRLITRHAFKNSTPGVAVLPILPSGEIVLNLNYRHAMRSWELEIPKGGSEPEESIEETAQRELKEETGLTVSSLIFLGGMASNSGILTSVIPVYMGRVSGQEAAHTEYSEAIAGAIPFTLEVLKKGLVAGFLEVSLNGEQRQIPIRDPFLTFALLQAELRGLL